MSRTKPEFSLWAVVLNFSTVDILEQIIHGGGGCPMHPWDRGSNPGLYTLNASRIPSHPNCDNQQSLDIA